LYSGCKQNIHTELSYFTLEESEMTFTKPYPHPHGMPSFWRTSPGELDTFRSSENIPETTDIAIIGAGFSGGSLVTHLLSTEEGRGKSILVLEARELCSGATGRNGTILVSPHVE
jgi:hypothetical protein